MLIGLEKKYHKAFKAYEQARKKLESIRRVRDHRNAERSLHIIQDNQGIVDMRHTAVSMRKTGKTFSEIGAALGVAQSEAVRIFKEAMRQQTNPEAAKIDGQTGVGNLGFSARVFNVLNGAGINTLEKLLAVSSKDLMLRRNFGKVCLLEIDAVLAKHGLYRGRPFSQQTVSAAPRPTRKVLERISTEVFRSHLFRPNENLKKLSDDTLFARIEKLCFQDHLRIPGMRSDADLAESGVYRQENPPENVLARALRAARKEHLQKILGNP